MEAVGRRTVGDVAAPNVGARGRTVILQEALVFRLERVEQHIGVILKVVGKAPVRSEIKSSHLVVQKYNCATENGFLNKVVYEIFGHSLPCNKPRIWIGVCDSFLDCFLQDAHMSLENRRGPRVQQLVEELAAVPPNVSVLARHVRREDGEEAARRGEADDEPHADDARGRHDFGRVHDGVDDGLQQVLEEAVELVAEDLGEVGDRDASLADNLKSRVSTDDVYES